MSGAADTMIEKGKEKVLELESELIRARRFVNQICEFEGLDPIYSDMELEPDKGASMRIERGAYYRKPFATAVRDYLMRRKSGGLGPATADEIFEALGQGSFDFQAKRAVLQKRSLQISLAKNTAAFERLPDDSFGLAEWYRGHRGRKGDDVSKEPAKKEGPQGEGSIELPEKEAAAETPAAENPENENKEDR